MKERFNPLNISPFICASTEGDQFANVPLHEVHDAHGREYTMTSDGKIPIQKPQELKVGHETILRNTQVQRRRRGNARR